MSLPGYSLEALVDVFMQDGYVVLKGAFASDAVSSMLRSLCGSDEYDSIACEYEDEDLALGASRTNFRIQKKKDGRLMSRALHAFMKRVDPKYKWYDSSIITALPHSKRQPTHRDYSMPTSIEDTWKIVVFTPLADVKNNGGVTVVYPGTQFGDSDVDSGVGTLAPEGGSLAPEGGSVRIRLNAGDALVFFSSLQHYGAANSRSENRILLSQTFEVLLDPAVTGQHIRGN